jgi:hypothetical protein
MNLLSLRRFAARVAVTVVALAAVLTSGAPAQSLGYVARQEEARRKGTTAVKPTGGKVYTNDDLRAAPAPASPAPSAAAAAGDAAKTDGARPADGAKPADGKTGAGKPADGKGTDAQAPADGKPAPAGKGDETMWRQRRQALQEALDRSKAFAEALQSQINGLTTDFAARDDPAQRATVGANRQRALTELERVKKEIAQNTKALADLQEEARRSGVPPGWLR